MLIAIGAYLGFTKDIPFTRPFELTAVFQNAPPIQKGTAVRIAGVDVGKVSKVEAIGGDSAGVKVTMKLEDKALPIHKDAKVKIARADLPRGQPLPRHQARARRAPTRVDDGGTIPASQTAAPVQLDQVLGTLQTNTRKDLQDLLVGLRRARSTASRQPGEDDDQDPDVKGETAGQALNKSLDYAPDALRGTAIVNQATARHRAARPLQADRGHSRRSRRRCRAARAS